MARLIESWKRSGWEYKFWDDTSAAEFLSLHFPPEVRYAYDSILPGAFKADLFRYCVLLIEGGIYADMDVMLQTNLDAAVPPDVGFMVPVDAVSQNSQKDAVDKNCTDFMPTTSHLSLAWFQTRSSNVFMERIHCVCTSSSVPFTCD